MKKSITIIFDDNGRELTEVKNDQCNIMELSYCLAVLQFYLQDAMACTIKENQNEKSNDNER